MSYQKIRESIALVTFALNKSGYEAAIVSAQFLKTTETDEIYEVTYYNDEGELETGRVYVNLNTGKGEY